MSGARNDPVVFHHCHLNTSKVKQALTDFSHPHVVVILPVIVRQTDELLFTSSLLSSQFSLN